MPGKILYKVVPKKSPKTQEVKWYPAAVLYSQISREDILAAAQRNSCVPRAYLELVFDALVTEVRNFVMNGHSIQIKGFGTIFATMRSKGAETAAKYDPGTLMKQVKFGFRPDPLLKRAAQQVQFEKVTTTKLP
ncbi:MAG: hypothetical protein IJ000_07350 [Paludibacteraceae bacterium]|nr:hypothetical protein [Paludibacteraceae bacterium]